MSAVQCGEEQHSEILHGMRRSEAAQGEVNQHKTSSYASEVERVMSAEGAAESSVQCAQLVMIAQGLL